MALKLYNVTVSVEVAVLAESAARAKIIAEREAQNEAFEAEAIESDGCYPAGWEPRSFVYGDHPGDITIADAIERYVPAESRVDLKLREAARRAQETGHG